MFQTPRPNDALTETLYTGGFYHSLNEEKFTEAFLGTKRRHVMKQLDWIQERAGLSSLPRKRALDIGCGVGICLDILRGRGWEVQGIESDPQLAAYGNEKFGLSIRQEFFKDGLFPPEHFTLVYNHHTYEHLANPLELTRWIRKIVAPDAVLFFAVPTYPWSFHFFSWEWMNVCHNTIFTHKTFSNCLAAAGFEMTDYKYDPYGEVWVLARPAAAAKTYPVKWWQVQMELWASPALFAAGIFHRAVRRLVLDPRYFFKRLARVFSKSW